VPLLPTILLVGGDEDERHMLRDALLEGSGPVDVRAVPGAEALEEYLNEGGGVGAPTPSLVLVARALVIGMGRDTGAFEIVKALVGLAHTSTSRVVAEGVEGQEQLDYLKVLGCEFVQGFHIAAPLSPQDAGELLREGSALRTARSR
jgi:hypothetical protein